MGVTDCSSEVSIRKACHAAQVLDHLLLRLDHAAPGCTLNVSTRRVERQHGMMLPIRDLEIENCE